MYNCHVVMHSENSAQIKLTDHDQGIAPGQFAVLYDGERCLGSGVIKDQS